MPTTQCQPTSVADLPLSSLQMEVRGVQRADPMAAPDASVDTPAATFELVFTTGAPVRRYDWANDRYYLEVLEVSPEAIDLSRLQRGAPLLNSHWAYTLEDQIGVVDQPNIDAGQGICQATLSRRDSVRGVVQDLQDRVIRNVSVGYMRQAIEMVAPSEDTGMWIYNIKRWTPMEVSLVSIPADMDSQVRSADGRLPDGRVLRTYPCQMQLAAPPPNTSPQQRTAAPAATLPIPTAGTPAATSTRNHESTTMPQTQAPAGGTTAPDQTRSTPAATPETTDATHAPAQTADAARAAGIQAERTRAADIRSAAQAARATLGDADTAALVTRLIDAGTSIDQARAQILTALTERSAETATRGAANIRTARDEVDTLRQRMSDALILRANPGATTINGAPIDVAGARNFRGMDLLDMARRSIAAAGGNADGLSRREIALAAMNLDQDAIRSAGMHGTSDFTNLMASTVNRSLRAAYEAAPRTFTAWARQSTNRDFREKAVLQLSGMSQFKKVNEGAEYKYMSFSDSAEKYSLSKYGGIIAITWESIINDDLSGFDRIPTMISEEAAALEGDLVYAALIGNPAMADTVALFHATHGNLLAAAAITDVTLGLGRAAMRKQTGANGRVLNLAPDLLIVGPDKEAEALKYTSSNFVAAKGVDINPAFNTSLSVVVDNRVTGNQWYLAAAPTRVDTVEYSYLEGESGLFTTRREGFEVDGVEIKARHVFAAKAIDHRGLQKNPGV